MISIDLRKPYLQKRRRQIQERLRLPGLPATERDALREVLQHLGKPKEYTWDEAPLPGALDPGPMPPVHLELELDSATFESLSALPHSRLFLFAQQEGLDAKPGDTKARIVKLILESHQGEKRP